jgi:hypothetical protein
MLARLKRIDWEQFTLNLMWILLLLFAVASLGVIYTTNKEVRDECTEKRGIVIQSRTGEFYCIKEKSIIK